MKYYFKSIIKDIHKVADGYKYSNKSIKSMDGVWKLPIFRSDGHHKHIVGYGKCYLESYKRNSYNLIIEGVIKSKYAKSMPSIVIDGIVNKITDHKYYNVIDEFTLTNFRLSESSIRENIVSFYDKRYILIKHYINHKDTQKDLMMW